jgi:alkanesulfonate monooxygenase SsuD/methylene tetrahydromethanopterin reductase-like flavin-dependent oxidoreductase (luciferase family)
MYVATGIYIAPLRHPLHTARAALTSAKLAGTPGRFKLGVGAGWMPEEFAALGSDFSSRFARLDETVAILRQSAHGGAFAHAGTHYQHEPVRLTLVPQPVPVIMGGVAPRALRRAADLADGWYNPGLTDLEQCQRIVATIGELRSRAGKQGDDFTFYIRVGAGGATDPSAYEDAGFRDLVVPWEALWSSEERQDLSLDGKLTRIGHMAESLGL